MNNLLWFAMILNLLVIFSSCHKAEQQRRREAITTTINDGFDAVKEIVTRLQVRVGESPIMLPAGSRIVIASDQSEARIILPAGYAYITNAVDAKVLPVLYSTYTCVCSKQGNPCKVFYADGMGFGCLQYSCAGSCTGKFTYMGYTVDKVISTIDKPSFFEDPLVQEHLLERLQWFPIVTGLKAGASEKAGDSDKAGANDKVYLKQAIFGVNYYVLVNAKSLPALFSLGEVIPVRAVCDCEGTKACKLRTMTLQTTTGNTIEIHFCDGPCNGCELTVD